MNRLLFLFSAILTTVSSSAQEEKPYVVLISFDGFRSDYVEKFNLTNFKKFVVGGAAAEGMIPSFPSKTFPNHYTIVTGLYPGHHGLVDNHFYDPASKSVYDLHDRNAVSDPKYYGGTPLWMLCKQQGVISASYFWVGSELREKYLRPDYYYPYDAKVSFSQRFDQVVSWLTLPQDKRPHFIAVYFSWPDTESHKYGPLAGETKTSLMKLDTLLGNFMDRVQAISAPVNVILVSDHGMSELSNKPETFIDLDKLIPSRHHSITAVNGGTQAHIYVSDISVRDSLYDALVRRSKDFSVLKREQFPAQWHYDNSRSGDLLVQAHPGHYIIFGTSEQNWARQQRPRFGAHGYDPAVIKDMQGIFYAKGPNIKAGSSVPAFENIHVYPLIATILGLKMPEIDGKQGVLKPLYQP